MACYSLTHGDQVRYFQITKKIVKDQFFSDEFPFLDGNVDVGEGCHFTSPAIFNHLSYHHWYDPGNWKSPRNNPAIPHYEQIPCRYDGAVFPPQVAFKVGISKEPVEISFMKINDIDLDSSHFRSIYSGGGGITKEIGEMTFQVNESVTIHQDTCPHGNEGCQCQRNRNQGDLICSMPGAKCADLPDCSSPLKPFGHCCYDFCGAILHIQKPWNAMDVPFNMDEAIKDIESLLKPKRSIFDHKCEFSS